LEELGRYQGIAEVTEDHIVNWANSRVRAVGKTIAMRSFKDTTLKNSMFLLELVSAIEPRAVDWEVVNNRADTYDAQMMNAKYCISSARKIGACVFLVPEDIVEVKSKMILTFVAGLWMADLVRFQPTK
jgi:plastin-1